MTDSGGPRIVGLGASMTAGTPGFFSPRERPPAGEGNEQSQYAYWMRRLRPGWEVLNRGMRGQRTDQILLRFEYDAVETCPDVLILLAGTNDLYQGRSARCALTRLEQMVLRTLEAGRGAVLSSLPPLNIASEDVKKIILDFNVSVRDLAGKTGAVFFDAYALMEDPSRPGFIRESPDGVHPDVAGYRRLGEALVPAVETALSRRAP